MRNIAIVAIPDYHLNTSKLTMNAVIFMSNCVYFCRSYFVVGLNAVMKSLEKNRLSLVLVTKETQPAVLKTAMLEMVQRQCNAAACVSDLLPVMKESWPALSSLTAFGVVVSKVLVTK